MRFFPHYPLRQKCNSWPIRAHQRQSTCKEGIKECHIPLSLFSALENYGGKVEQVSEGAELLERAGLL